MFFSSFKCVYNHSIPGILTYIFFIKREKIYYMARFWHEVNESKQEANNAIVRILMPQFFGYDDSTDTFNSNITASFTNKHYLDFDVSKVVIYYIYQLSVKNPFLSCVAGL